MIGVDCARGVGLAAPTPAFTTFLRPSVDVDARTFSNIPIPVSGLAKYEGAAYLDGKVYFAPFSPNGIGNKVMGIVMAFHQSSAVQVSCKPTWPSGTGLPSTRRNLHLLSSSEGERRLLDPGDARRAADDLDAVETRMLDLVRRLGMEDDLYMVGLGCRLDMTRQGPLADKLLELRGSIAADPDLAEMRRDFIDVFDADSYAPNASLADNLFFGLPRDPNLTWADFADDRAVQRALDEAGVKVMLVEVGLDLCDTLISLFEGVAADSDLFKRYGLFPRAETPAVEAILRKSKQRGPARLNRSEQARMMGIAFSYCSARYRLGVMRESERVEALLAARPAVRAALKDDPRFAPFDADAYHPAMSIADNIFFGPTRVERRDSWQPFKEKVDALVEERGLRGLILRAGVDQRLGENGIALNALQRRKLGLARALIKHPSAIVLDGLAMSDSGPDQALRALIRDEMDGGAVIWGAASEQGAAQADHVIRVDANGHVSQGCGPASGSDAGSGGVDGGSDAG